MLLWIAIIGGAAVVGLLTARLMGDSRAAVWVAGVIAWLGMLAYLLINEYVLPYRGGGASMWPIAQLFGGTVAAFVAVVTCTLARARHRRQALAALPRA